jgi:Flp pilus assembly pilin Flp
MTASPFRPTHDASDDGHRRITMADTDFDTPTPRERVPNGLLSLDDSDGPPTSRTGWTVGALRGTHAARKEHCLRTMVVALHAAVHVGSIPGGPDGRLDQQGQSTVEYALILLGAAAIALALVSWVTGSNVVGRLFDTVIDRILGRV